MLTELEPTKERRRRERPPVIIAAHADVALLPADEVCLGEPGAAVFGLTVKAIEGKIARGDWIEGRQYHRAPDGRIWISRRGVSRWVTTGRA